MPDADKMQYPLNQKFIFKDPFFVFWWTAQIALQVLSKIIHFHSLHFILPYHKMQV